MHFVLSSVQQSKLFFQTIVLVGVKNRKTRFLLSFLLSISRLGCLLFGIKKNRGGFIVIKERYKQVLKKCSGADILKRESVLWPHSRSEMGGVNHVIHSLNLHNGARKSYKKPDMQNPNQAFDRCMLIQLILVKTSFFSPKGQSLNNLFCKTCQHKTWAYKTLHFIQPGSESWNLIYSMNFLD